jgi:hypothetical protein
MEPLGPGYSKAFAAIAAKFGEMSANRQSAAAVIRRRSILSVGLSGRTPFFSGQVQQKPQQGHRPTTITGLEGRSVNSETPNPTM